MIHELSDERVYDISQGLLSEYFDLGISGYRMTREMAWDMILSAATEYGSIESKSQDLKTVVLIP